MSLASLSIAELLAITDARLLKFLETKTEKELSADLNEKLEEELERISLQDLKRASKSYGYKQRDASKAMLVSFIKAEFDTRISHSLTILRSSVRSPRKRHLPTSISSTFSVESIEGEQNNLATVTQPSSRPTSPKRKRENEASWNLIIRTLNEMMEKLAQLWESQTTILQHQEQIKNDLVAIKQSLAIKCSPQEKEHAHEEILGI